MPVDQNGVWQPNIFARQAELINLCRSGTKRYILSSGPRLSGKTIGCLHALVDHAWNVDNANIVIVTVTQSAGYDSGVWTDLTEVVIPEWIAGDFGLEWVNRPAIQHVSKKPYCTIRNRFGGKSKFQLESLKNESEVEQRFKGKRYSCMMINELSNFRHRKTLDTWSECLRMIGLPMEKHFLLADTNPADEGTRSWIYKLWFDFRNAEPDNLSLSERILQQQLGVVEFTIDDNTFLPEARVNALKGMLASNPDLYARYVEGRWVTSSTESLFADVFKENIHVVGEIETRSNRNPLILAPEDNCFELYTGWDLGVTNSAAVIIEKTFNPDDEFHRPIFKVLDELVIIGEDFLMEDFVVQFVERMKFWAARVKTKNLKWTHYSDRSALDMRDVSTNRLHHQIVWDASPPDTPGGPIQLIAAARGRNSVQNRVDLFRKLLWEDRIYLSRQYCPNAIEMVKSIRRGRNTVAPIEKGSQYKHVFDAITYCVATECYDEMMSVVLSLLKPKDENLPSGLVAVGL